MLINAIFNALVGNYNIDCVNSYFSNLNCDFWSYSEKSAIKEEKNFAILDLRRNRLIKIYCIINENY